jgi:molybdate transport system regulatory protein
VLRVAQLWPQSANKTPEWNFTIAMTGNPKVQISMVLANGAVIGPRKIALLEAIEAKGSITVAARSLQISYRYAWQLVQSINDMFCEPAVVTAVGGTNRGGAKLSAIGTRVVATYRAAQSQARASSLNELHTLNAMGRDR